MSESVILPATEEEWNEVSRAFSSALYWVAKVEYQDDEAPAMFYKFTRAYDVKVSDFYGGDKSMPPIKSITIR